MNQQNCYKAPPGFSKQGPRGSSSFWWSCCWCSATLYLKGGGVKCVWGGWRFPWYRRPFSWCRCKLTMGWLPTTVFCAALTSLWSFSATEQLMGHSHAWGQDRTELLDLHASAVWGSESSVVPSLPESLITSGQVFTLVHPQAPESEHRFHWCLLFLKSSLIFFMLMKMFFSFFAATLQLFHLLSVFRIIVIGDEYSWVKPHNETAWVFWWTVVWRKKF